MQKTSAPWNSRSRATASWLGITDVVTEGQFVGADGCGIVSSNDPVWAEGQPNDWENQDFAVLVPHAAEHQSPGWNDAGGYNLGYPLCQLADCYRSRCQ